MRVLVTGGAGFIGSSAAARFVKEGHDVVVVDNFNPYYDPDLKHKRVCELIPSVSVHYLDITDKSVLNELFERSAFDVVAHFASQAGVRYSVTNPETYVQNNVLATQVLLEVMQRHAVSHLVYASTSSVYGTSTKVPFTEREPADKPVSVYAATKRASELLAHSYYEQYGINVTCLRFFTVYGPWSRPDMAMLKFAEQITQGRPIDIYNYGNLRRDFTYIDDIVDGFSKALTKPMGYEIINLGNGKPVDLLYFVELLEDYLGVSAQKNMLKMQQGDVFETFADITKARQLLGYEPMTTFEEGLRNFVVWFKEHSGQVV